MTINRFPIEEGAIQVFAQAIGDSNPIYSDREHASNAGPGGILAPPTFVQSSAHFDPDYPFRPKIGEPWFGSGKTATGISRSRTRRDGGGGGGVGTGLHAEQHYIYHRPLRAGDVLSATVRVGNQWEKQGRSGNLKFTESITEYRTLEGELVVTSRSVGVQTERPVSQER